MPNKICIPFLVLGVLYLSMVCIIPTSSTHLSTKLWSEQEEDVVQFGPRIDKLMIKMPADFELLEVNEIDLIDQPLNKELIGKWSNPPYNETIALEKYNETGIYLLDINNNETIPTYRNWHSLTSYPEFRHAIAHLVNRTRVISEILDGYGVALTTPVFPWLEKWINQNADSHAYDPMEAATILDEAGFIQGSTENPYYNPSKPGSAQFIRVYPPDHEKAGQNLDPLIFYVRHDHPERKAAAYIIRDELLSLGIPVVIPGPIKIQELIDKVWRYGDYHLYTGGWSLYPEPAYMYWLYHSSQYGYPQPNYNNIHDPELDYWLEKLLNSTTQEEATIACKEAQRRMSEIVGVVPLWAPVRVKACDRNWQGLINEESYGIDGWWSFLNAHPKDVEYGGTLKYGISWEIQSLNPVFASWYSDWLVLDKIYDTLIKRNPYNITEAVPNLVESIEVKTWSENKTKLVFNLRKNVYWHDGFNFTSEDVKFTIEYLLSFWEYPMWGLPLPTFYSNVADVDHVETTDPYTIIVYMKEPGIWALYDVGEVPILPKHIWQNISNPLDFSPDPQLIGTGPFKFEEYVNGSYFLLETNKKYFRYFKPSTWAEPRVLRVFTREVRNLTLTLEILGPYNISDVNITSLVLENIEILHPVKISIGDKNNNGVPDITIQLNENEIQEYVLSHLMENARNYKFFHGFAILIELTIRGEIGNIDFRVSDKITVVSSVAAIPI